MHLSKPPRICLLVDVKGWAFDKIALRIKHRLEPNVDVDIVYMDDYQKGYKLYLRVFMQAKPYDLVHFFWRETLSQLYHSAAVADAVATLSKSGAESFLLNIATVKKTTWICDHLFLDATLRSLRVRRALTFSDNHAVSSKILANLYHEFERGMPHQTVIVDGVDLALFKPAPRERALDDAVKIGWAGNSAWGPNSKDHKGLISVIKPAINKLKKAGYLVEGKFCDRQQRWTPHEEMPGYYHSIDIYVCASLTEGTPNPVLEAMACGLPILTTNVGIVSQAFGPLQQEFIVTDRHSEDFATKLQTLVENPGLRRQLAQENIKAIKHWDWSERIVAWERFLIGALDSMRDSDFTARQLANLNQSLGVSSFRNAPILHRPLRKDVGSPKVCLAMLVCNESATIKRCLNSVAGFIDSYFILDTGSTDDTRDIIQQATEHISGTLEQVEFTSFSDLRQRLFARASLNSDLVLFMDADETLHSVSQCLTLNHDLDVGWVEVATANYSLMQPRLIRVATQVECIGAYAESIEFPDDVKQGILDTVRIHHHCDGIRHTDRQHLGDEEQYLLGKIVPHECATTYLNLARVYLRKNDIEKAREMLLQCCQVDSADASKWQAHYFLGVIFEASASSMAEASAHYQNAFNLAPDRAEPLYRLIKMQIANNEFKTAEGLANIAAEMIVPIHTAYFERRVYEQEIAACQRLIANELTKSEANTSLIAATHIYPSNQQSKPIESADTGLSEEMPKQAVPAIQTPRLTIGMATYDDYDGVYFSVMALSLYHSEVLDDIEVIVIDNNPAGTCAEALRRLCDSVSFARYIPVDDIRGTAVRDRIFAYARAATVMCIDSHVMLFPNSIKRLMVYFDDHPDCDDLYQGPLVRDDRSNAAYCLRASWSKGMLGVWESDPKMLDPDLQPFEIGLQGLGLFACRKSAWPGFNPRFSGFGGEEGYIHEKFRQRGAKVICLPFLQWIHRFERPNGTRYPNVWEDRIRNYLIGHTELGQDTRELENHFSSHVGFSLMAGARKQFDAERAQALFQFDAIYCVAQYSPKLDKQALAKQLHRLGVAHRVLKIKASMETDCPLKNRLITQQLIVQRAQLYGYERILIIDDQSLFHQKTQQILDSAITELLKQAWDICYFDLETDPTNTPTTSQNLDQVKSGASLLGQTTHGYVIAINHTGYSRFINDEVCLESHETRTEELRVYAVKPKIATRIELLLNDDDAVWFMEPNEA